MIFWVAAGGAVGAAARYLVNVTAGKWLGSEFPWGTFAANVAGCFVMGVLISLMAHRWNVSLEMRAFLTTGVLGGFTTFSAFSLDFAVLYERKAYLLAALYALGSVGLCLVAVFAGLLLVRHLVMP